MDKKTALRMLQIENTQPSLNEIKDAFRVLSSKYHPDKNKNKPIFTNLFQEINTAYQYLLKDFRAKNDSEVKGYKLMYTCKICRRDTLTAKKVYEEIINEYEKFICGFCIRRIKESKDHNNNSHELKVYDALMNKNKNYVKKTSNSAGEKDGFLTRILKFIINFFIS